MGITGLLPFIEKASKKCNVSEFSNTTVAIDAYCWLHKGAFCCADKLVRGEYTDAHIKYCMKYVNMLLSHSIKPILVFDGRHLPAKALTESKRRESRTTAKKRAAELLRLGQNEEARSYMRRSVDITHEMALQLIKECRSKNVDSIVAPYEADAQMAYLNRCKIADIIITEDSDLVLFGCSKVFFKMDLNGNGVLVENTKLPLVMKCPLEHYTFDKFRQMCIMSGCDYLPSLPGIGLAKARQFVNASRDSDFINALKKLPSYFNKTQLVVTDEYRESFAKAEATFKHQLVYDPICRRLLPLNSLESEGTDKEMCSNAGEELEPEIAFQLALGNLDPFTLKQMDNWHPDHHKPKAWNPNNIAPHKSIWSTDYMEYASSRVNKKNKSTPETAISFLCTRALTSKNVVTSTGERNENNLTMDDLTSMYCIKEPVKANVIIPETQDFDDIDVYLHTSKNPFKCDTSANNFESPASAKKRTREKENSLSPEKNKSPILESKNNKNFRKFLQSNSLSKYRRTTLDTNNVVESKFFNNSVSFSAESTVNLDESNTSLGGAIQNMKVDESGEEPKETDSNHLDPVHLMHIMGDGDLIDIEKKKNVNPFSVSIFSSETVESQKSCNENTYPLEDLITPSPSQEFSSPKKPFNGLSSSQSLENKLEKLICPSNSAANNDTVKGLLKSNKCRRPGLQKRSSAPVLSSGQKTLASFGFFQKQQLKH